VKEPLKLPFVFLFILLCVTVVLSALTLFSAWGLSASGAPFDLAWLLGHFAAAAFEVLIPAVVISIVLLGFRMARRPFSRLGGFLITLCAGYIVLVNGMILLSSLSGKAGPAPSGTRSFLQPETFMRLGTAVIAPAAVSGDRLGGVLFYDAAAPQEHLTVYPASSVSTGEGGLSVALFGQTQREVSGEPLAARSSLFAPDALSAPLLRDVRTLTEDFQQLMQRGLPDFFAACFALVFLCAASLAILRVTRWPLANIMLLMLAVRGYFLLYHLLATRFAAAVAGAVTDPLLARLFPSASFIVLGVLLLLVDILFIPADRWSRIEPA